MMPSQSGGSAVVAGDEDGQEVLDLILGRDAVQPLQGFLPTAVQQRVQRLFVPPDGFVGQLRILSGRRQQFVDFQGDVDPVRLDDRHAPQACLVQRTRWRGVPKRWPCPTGSGRAVVWSCFPGERPG
jgi:hypothetical protein